MLATAIKNYTIALMVLGLLYGCSPRSKYDAMQKSLSEFAAGKDANIGIAVIIDGTDTVEVNGNKEYPMLSVYKFPIALALGEYYRQHNMSLEDSVAILPEDLHLDTYSPMTERILASSRTTTDTLKKPTAELLAYTLQQSDNNASDIILKTLGGTEYVDKYIRRLGIAGINVKNTEDEMHIDNTLCYANSSTPIGMASLMDKFDREFNDPISLEIKRLMETCETGTNRLAEPLTDALIGHKTGTGFTLPGERLMAVNDAGYVHLSNGHRYAIAVFIENSGYDMEQTEALIAEISRIVYSRIKRIMNIE